MAIEKVTRVSESSEGQGVELTDRSEMRLSGVKDVLAFSDNTIELETNMGMLSVKGDGLKILNLSTEKKTAQICGKRIDMLEYKKQKEARSFCRNLFR